MFNVIYDRVPKMTMNHIPIFVQRFVALSRRRRRRCMLTVKLRTVTVILNRFL